MPDKHETKLRAEQYLHKVADHVAKEVIERHYPGNALDIESRIERQDAVVYKLANKYGEKQVLRLSSNPHWLADNTAKAHQAWRELKVPTPEVFAHGQIERLQYIVMEYIHDRLFDFTLPYETQLTTMSSMAATLARMRSVTIDGFGYLNESGVGSFAAWPDFLAYRYTPQWAVENGILDANEAQKVKDFIAELRPGPATAVLLHGDFKPKNMAIDSKGNVTVVTDPQVLGGDPLWDVATFNHFIYREQARQGKDLHDDAFSKLRNNFYQAYVEALGHDLDGTEQKRLMGYELVIGAEKVERLLRRAQDSQEAKQILKFTKQKLSDFTPFG